MERQVIEGLAKRWNLDRIPEVQDFHYAYFKDGVARIGDPMGTQILRPFTFFGGGRFVPWEFKVSFAGRYWTWAPTSTRSFKDFRDGIMRDLGISRPRSLPPELRERFRELAKEASNARRFLSYNSRARDLHVCWLFLRLCPQPDRPLTIFEIAKRKWENERNVYRRVNVVAKVLGIDLPPGRRGRPSQTISRLTSPGPPVNSHF